MDDFSIIAEKVPHMGGDMAEVTFSFANPSYLQNQASRCLEQLYKSQWCEIWGGSWAQVSSSTSTARRASPETLDDTLLNSISLLTYGNRDR